MESPTALLGTDWVGGAPTSSLYLKKKKVLKATSRGSLDYACPLVAILRLTTLCTAFQPLALGLSDCVKGLAQNTFWTASEKMAARPGL